MHRMTKHTESSNTTVVGFTAWHYAIHACTACQEQLIMTDEEL